MGSMTMAEIPKGFIKRNECGLWHAQWNGIHCNFGSWSEALTYCLDWIAWYAGRGGKTSTSLTEKPKPIAHIGRMHDFLEWSRQNGHTNVNRSTLRSDQAIHITLPERARGILFSGYKVGAWMNDTNDILDAVKPNIR